ncbi:ribonuclease Z [Bradymonas sediminis]|nr:ribonuclease Z [Bradymonas sediminis]
MAHRGVASLGIFRQGKLYLFDCGEGTQVQLSRSSLRSGALESIFLTHFHGDHVNGLPGFAGSLTLNRREEALGLYGPVGLNQWLKTLRDLHILWPSFPINVHENTKPGVVYEEEDFHIEIAPLRHRIETWGYALVEKPRPGRFDVNAARALGVPSGPMFGKLQRGESVTLEDGRTIAPEDVLGPDRPGLKIAYVSDTSPCDGALQLAEGADLLIHEATYPAGDEKMAHQRGHSTAGDAARCAKKAGAKKLIMTHISQKYLRTDEFVRGARAIFPNSSVAHDLMEYDLTRSDQ